MQCYLVLYLNFSLVPIYSLVEHFVSEFIRDHCNSRGSCAEGLCSQVRGHYKMRFSVESCDTVEFANLAVSTNKRFVQ